MERRTARAIIVTDEAEAVLIHRVKKGREYYVVPGGGVNDGETEEETVIREGKEELGVGLFIKRKIGEIRTSFEGVEITNVLFECGIAEGTLGTGTGPEFSENDPDNTFEVVTIGRQQAEILNIVPAEIKDVVSRMLNKEAVIL